MDRLNFSLLNEKSKDNFNASNIYNKTGDNSNCNPFSANNNMDNYFQECSKELQSAVWGSNKPAPDNCELNPKVVSLVIIYGIIKQKKEYSSL